MKLLLRAAFVLYLVFPLIIIPYIAHKEQDWYYLIGIACYYAGILMAVLNQKIFFPIPLIFSLWFWYTYGFSLHQYVTVFFASLAAGLLFNTVVRELDKFINRKIPEKQQMIEYEDKIQEMNARLEQYKKDHPGKKITMDVIEEIKKEVFF